MFRCSRGSEIRETKYRRFNDIFDTKTLNLADVLSSSPCAMQLVLANSRERVILGDPGATSRDDAIFSGERHFWRESLLQGLKSPWALFLTKRVPEVVEIRPADWPDQRRGLAG